MTQATKHTPTPWKVSGPTYYTAERGNAAPYAGVSIKAASGESVCTIPSSVKRGALQRDADYQFIVTACNAHDELVAALRDCVQAIESEIDAAGDDRHPVIAGRIKTAKRARAALAKVQS
jgi:hypothetical protein